MAPTLADVEALCREPAQRLGFDARVPPVQPRGRLVDGSMRRAWHAAGKLVGVILNAGAYTHTGGGAARRYQGRRRAADRAAHPNVHAREAFRHHSFISPAAGGIIVGLGVNGYALAIEALVRVSSIESASRYRPRLGPAKAVSATPEGLFEDEAGVRAAAGARPRRSTGTITTTSGAFRSPTTAACSRSSASKASRRA